MLILSKGALVAIVAAKAFSIWDFDNYLNIANDYDDNKAD
jgi:hypothetical protein